MTSGEVMTILYKEEKQGGPLQVQWAGVKKRWQKKAGLRKGRGRDAGVQCKGKAA